MSKYNIDDDVDMVCIHIDGKRRNASDARVPELLVREILNASNAVKELRAAQEEIEAIEKNTDYWADRARELEVENKKLKVFDEENTHAMARMGRLIEALEDK